MLLKAIEEKTFLPVGSDKEVSSDFQLIAGTNRDLRDDIVTGKFREDLLARLDIWTFQLPALRERQEDIEPNIDYELARYSQSTTSNIRFNVEARKAFLKFATSISAPWSGNFRELSASITRMATLADGGRITEDTVANEISRLQRNWTPQKKLALTAFFTAEKLANIDLFDQLQLESVISICRQSSSIADAGRKLFANSRQHRSVANDSDRLRKFLGRFDLDWSAVTKA
jgi:transcriptional regulatory protein RtcR